ncbi:hypothetical protein ACFSCZ_01415 [Siminovitchia sediminis]|uniref:Resolvase HTH domain-containing protein n=1 Tax=Siminovitchia sediminis TaxID=1274353 RepID=A0ABW4KDA6_9BACI
MNTVIIVLLSLSTVLFIISMFQKDKLSQFETEFEELTMTLLQENHNLKKRIGVLEEELLLEKQLIDAPVLSAKRKASPLVVHEVLKNQVIALHQQGMDLQRIASQSSLPVDTVKHIIKDRQDPAGRMI